MTEPREERNAERIDRIVGDVLAGRHLKATPSDASDHEAIQLAARLAGSRDGYPRMSPAFRRRLTRLLQKGEAPAWVNRRSALVAGLGLAAGAVGGALATELGGLFSPARPARGRMEPRPELGRWVDTGLTLADLEDGVPRRVTAGAIGAFLVRHGGRVAAMSAYCTHVPCELVWLADRNVLNCPCHNLAFNLDDGQPMSSRYPPLPALPTVKVRVQPEGRLEVLGT
jgi:cytochrome b6-f complex iron-sulfur subunit